jgi:hypothetical protein
MTAENYLETQRRRKLLAEAQRRTVNFMAY